MKHISILVPMGDVASGCIRGLVLSSPTYCSMAEYIHKVKIEAAKKSFELGRKNIDEIMRDVGYSNTKAFKTIFKKITGLSPLEYRNKYNKESGIQKY